MIPPSSLVLANLVLVLSSWPTRAGAAALSSLGCYSSAGSLTLNDTYTWQSSSYCLGQCTGIGAAVLGLTLGGDCLCGNAIPDGKVDSSYCDTTCFGWSQEYCGGTGYYTVYLTGVGTLENPDALLASSSSAVSSSTASSTSSSPTSTSISTSTATSTASSMTTSSSSSVTSSSSATTVPTSASSTDSTSLEPTSAATSSASASSSEPASSGGSASGSTKSSGKSGISGGAIAGIVVGVIGGLAIVGLIVFFFWRRRRQQDGDEWEDYGGKPKRGALSHSSPANVPALPHEKLSSNSVNSGRVTIVDQRLNPIMHDRRMSDGSLSDEQDYSRKILRVVNMD